MNVAVTGKSVWITPPGIQPGQLVGYRPFHLRCRLARRTGPSSPPAARLASHARPAREVSSARPETTGAAQWFIPGPVTTHAGASGVTPTRKRICCRIATRCSGGCSLVVRRRRRAVPDRYPPAGRMKERDGDGQAGADFAAVRVARREPGYTASTGTRSRWRAIPAPDRADQFDPSRAGKLAWISG